MYIYKGSSMQMYILRALAPPINCYELTKWMWLYTNDSSEALHLIPHLDKLLPAKWL